jgi:DNA-directed RNA polymerase subunit F
VRNGIYRAFDSAGRLLRLDVRNDRETFFNLIPVVRERVTVSLAEEEPSHREELRTILASYLEVVGEAKDALTRMSFDELVAAASRHSMRPSQPVWWLRR